MSTKHPYHFNVQELAFLVSVPGVGRSTILQIENTLKKYEIETADFWVKFSQFDSNNLIPKKTFESIKKTLLEYKISDFWQKLEEKNFRVISLRDSQYPFQMQQASDVPVVLFVKSQLKVGELQKYWDRNSHPIAVVGSRRPTPYGKLVTQTVVPQLVASGCTIVSGCMYGVDEIAHRVTRSFDGKIVGVLGFGFNHCYPASLQDFLDEIVETNGVLISEYPPDTAPSPGLFAARNRIIAYISKGVLVCEAGEKSGSHITAQVALDEGRSVYTVGSPINNPYSGGAKWLINQGAIMIDSGTDILRDLQILPTESGVVQHTISQVLYDMLVEQALDIDTIYKKASDDPNTKHIQIQQINQALTNLELNGNIVRSGVYYESCHR